MRAFFHFLAIGFVGVVLGAVLAACTPESRHALPNEMRAAADERFVGIWRNSESTGVLQGSRATLRIAADPAEPLDLLLDGEETWRSSSGDHHRTFRARLRFYAVAGRSVIAVQRLDGPEEERSWRFASYRFGGNDGFAAYFMDEPRLYTLVRNGALAGRIRGGEPEFPDLLLTDDAQRLASVIRTTDPNALFTLRVGPFVRGGN